MSMLTQREQGQAPEILGPSIAVSSLPSPAFFAYAHRVSMATLGCVRVVDSKGITWCFSSRC